MVNLPGAVCQLSKIPIVVLHLNMIFISLERMSSLADIPQELLSFHQFFSRLDPSPPPSLDSQRYCKCSGRRKKCLDFGTSLATQGENTASLDKTKGICTAAY